jgi:CBS domain-containing protein/PII-like signaling protein
MSERYSLIEIHTRESARHGGKALYEAVIDAVRARNASARCIVLRGIAGCFEDGSAAAQHIVDLSYDMPIKIEIVLPSDEVEGLLTELETVVTDGLVTRREVELCSRRAPQGLLPPQLCVRDAMTPNPQRVYPLTPTAEAVRMLLGADFHALPVVDEAERPVGIVTQGDLLARAGLPLRPGLLGGVGEPGIETLVGAMPALATGEVMSANPVTIGEDRPLTEAASQMLERKLKRLPVVDAQGKLVGMLARLDLFRAITGRRAEAPEAHETPANPRSVREVMRQDLPTARPDTPLEELVGIIDSNDIQRVAVVDATGKLLGMVSDRDLLATVAGQAGGLWERIRTRIGLGEGARVRRELLKAAKARTAAEVMCTNLVTVREDTPLEEAMRLAVEYRLKRLPVVAADGQFLGVVGRDALLRAAQKSRED